MMIVICAMLTCRVDPGGRETSVQITVRVPFVAVQRLPRIHSPGKIVRLRESPAHAFVLERRGAIGMIAPARTYRGISVTRNGRVITVSPRSIVPVCHSNQVPGGSQVDCSVKMLSAPIGCVIGWTMMSGPK